MSWTIKKDFSFCYGHRVWSQNVDQDLALTSQNKCRGLHGHEGLVTVRLRTLHPHGLDDSGMVTDFAHLQIFKQWLDLFIDHHFILDYHDPLMESLFGGPSQLGYFRHFNLWGNRDVFIRKNRVSFNTHDIFVPNAVESARPTDKRLANTSQQEAIESLVLVPFVPTSENLAKWMFGVVCRMLRGTQGNMDVLSVEFHESPKTSAVYQESD